MDANISNRFERLREGVDANENDDAEEQEEESASHSSSNEEMSIPSRGFTMTPKSPVCVPFANND
jgi:hypothetical protein